MLWANNDTHLTKKNFDKFIKDHLKAVARFPNIGNQLICWLCVAKKPVFLPMHECMGHQLQLFSYLNGSLLCQTMELPKVQEKSKQIFLPQIKAQQFKFSETNKMVSTDPPWLVSFFEQCQTADKVAMSLISSRRRISQRKTKQLISCCLHPWFKPPASS